MQPTADAIARRLATTVLSGTALNEVPLPDNAGNTWVVDLPAGDLASMWAAARTALAPLGLYPVAAATWGAQDWVKADLFSRVFYGDEDATPAAVIAHAQTLSVEQALEHFAQLRHDEWVRENWDVVVDQHLQGTESVYGRRPEPAILADVPLGDELALERQLLAWEETQRPTEAPATSPSFDWYDPRPHEALGLVLLPLAQPCHVPAYLSFFGAEGPGGHEALTRLMCFWQQDFGAQLVASWGTMLQFVSSSPPATLDTAFDLAAQHVCVAPYTTQQLGESVRDLARHLWRGERWFLHERP